MDGRRAEKDRHRREVDATDTPRQTHPLSPRQYVAPPPASTRGEVDELSRLAQMHDSGMLADDEFTAAKAQLLDM